MMKQHTKQFLRTAMFSLCAVLFAAATANAATYTVTTTADTGAGTLRQAITDANASADVDDTINFTIPAGDAGCASGTCTITITGSELPQIADAGTLLIDNSAGANGIVVSGNNAFRVFSVGTGANLTLTAVTVTGGKPSASAGGGGIFNSGTLTLNNVTVTGNTTSGTAGGGGIFSNGTAVTLNNSVVSNNTTGGQGGGIYSRPGTLTINNTIISGNSAVYGGGISKPSGPLTLTNSIVSNNTATNDYGGISSGILSGTATLTNSTVSGNTAGATVGGIFNANKMTLTNSTVSGNTAATYGGILTGGSGGAMTLNNSTVSGNTAADGSGGISNVNGTLTLNDSTVAFNSLTNVNCAATCAGGISNNATVTSNSVTLTMTNTIVAKNTAAGSAAAPDVNGTAASTSSYNLIGDGTGVTSGITNGADGNQIGTTAAPIDPLLAALADNGGQTQTHLLQTGSPAIDKGNAAAADQRGAARPVDNTSIVNATGGNGADIGAVETALAPTAANVIISGRVVTPEGRGLLNAIVYVTDAAGATRAARTTTFGRFRFDDIAAGQTVVLSVSSKRYQFAPQVFGADEDATEIVLQAQTEATKQIAPTTTRSGAKP